MSPFTCQGRVCLLVQEVSTRAHPGAIGAADVKFGVPALLADVDLRDVGLADFGTAEVDPGVALIAFDHGPSGKGLHAETSHEVPGIVI